MPFSVKGHRRAPPKFKKNIGRELQPLLPKRSTVIDSQGIKVAVTETKTLSGWRVVTAERMSVMIRVVGEAGGREAPALPLGEKQGMILSKGLKQMVAQN